MKAGSDAEGSGAESEWDVSAGSDRGREETSGGLNRGIRGSGVWPRSVRRLGGTSRDPEWWWIKMRGLGTGGGAEL